jgi:hypothetical protein
MTNTNDPSNKNCTKQTHDMSDSDDHGEIISNQDTRTRRAWVERALQAVRRRLDSGQGLPEGLPEADPAAERPQLRVVPSGRKR